jgi:hypothetical protein
MRLIVVFDIVAHQVALHQSRVDPIGRAPVVGIRPTAAKIDDRRPSHQALKIAIEACKKADHVAQPGRHRFACHARSRWLAPPRFLVRAENHLRRLAVAEVNHRIT